MALQIEKIFAEIPGPKKLQLIQALIEMEEVGFLAAIQEQSAKDVLSLARSEGHVEGENLSLKYASMEYSIVSIIVESFRHILDNNTERKEES